PVVHALLHPRRPARSGVLPGALRDVRSAPARVVTAALDAGAAPEGGPLLGLVLHDPRGAVGVVHAYRLRRHHAGPRGPRTGRDADLRAALRRVPGSTGARPGDAQFPQGGTPPSRPGSTRIGRR